MTSTHSTHLSTASACKSSVNNTEGLSCSTPELVLPPLTTCYACMNSQKQHHSPFVPPPVDSDCCPVCCPVVVEYPCCSTSNPPSYNYPPPPPPPPAYSLPSHHACTPCPPSCPDPQPCYAEEIAPCDGSCLPQHCYTCSRQLPIIESQNGLTRPTPIYTQQRNEEPHPSDLQLDSLKLVSPVLDSTPSSRNNSPRSPLYVPQAEIYTPNHSKQVTPNTQTSSSHSESNLNILPDKILPMPRNTSTKLFDNRISLQPLNVEERRENVVVLPNSEKQRLPSQSSII
ncbi:hypothetical protein K7432_017125 [Basidiobolus ranarum]